MSEDQNRLRVSISSDVRNERMTVELHEADEPLIIGIVKDSKQVIFQIGDRVRKYDFEDAKAALQDFINTMSSVEND